MWGIFCLFFTKCWEKCWKSMYTRKTAFWHLNRFISKRIRSFLPDATCTVRQTNHIKSLNIKSLRFRSVPRRCDGVGWLAGWFGWVGFLLLSSRSPWWRSQSWAAAQTPARPRSPRWWVVSAASLWEEEQRHRAAGFRERVQSANICLPFPPPHISPHTHRKSETWHAKWNVSHIPLGLFHMSTWDRAHKFQGWKGEAPSK